MKKFKLSGPFHADWLRRKNLTMKLTTLLLLVSLFKIQANSYAQNTKISLNLNNATVQDVFNEIESRSDFSFLYNHEKVDLKRNVSVHADKKRISTILEQMFSGTDIYFTVRNKQIILKTGNTIDEDESGAIQQHTVAGTITDSDGAPLPGANILEKGTTNGVTADFDGNFSIAVADENAVLVISYIGFATQEVAINGRVQISVN